MCIYIYIYIYIMENFRQEIIYIFFCTIKCNCMSLNVSMDLLISDYSRNISVLTTVAPEIIFLYFHSA